MRFDDSRYPMSTASSKTDNGFERSDRTMLHLRKS